jgi:hypothetical protein
MLLFRAATFLHAIFNYEQGNIFEGGADCEQTHVSTKEKATKQRTRF